ncbi:uncharacterized protein LOC105212839 isoform X2 [Zeugodacus cucurbitae]|nr:uncharacterized protein LOC105212839 isoform X2 [Zeugodacus cucurbitae]
MSDENLTIYENSLSLTKSQENIAVYGKMVSHINTGVNEGKSYRNERTSSVNYLKSGLMEKMEPIYENIKQKVFSSQKLQLKNFFGIANKNDIIYENLCRGCGYGMFEGKKYLCDFCICMVEGPKNYQSQKLRNWNKIHVNTEENIYENICAKCSNLYNTEECEFCKTNYKLMDARTIGKKIGKLDAMNKSEKTMSFQYLDKPKFFHGILGSLKKGLKNKQSCSNIQECGIQTPKPVEVIHNIKENHEILPPNVIFNIQRILDYKQEKSSHSTFGREQNIYGRLKFSEHFVGKIPLEVTSDHKLSKTHELTENSIECSFALVNQNKLSPLRKRPKTSEMLKNIPERYFNTPNYKVLAAPLSESVCYWVKSVRQQVHNYHTYGAYFDDGDYALCIPKSIPSRSVLMHTYSTPASSYGNYNFVSPFYLEIGMTHFAATDKKVEEENTTFTNNISHVDVSEQIENRFDAMVDVFKQNLMTKYMFHKQRGYQTSVEYSKTSLNTLSEANNVARSSLQRIKWPSERSPISVMYYQPLSAVTAEKCLTSCFSTCNVIESKCNDRGCLKGGGKASEKSTIHKNKYEKNKYNNTHAQYMKQINCCFFDIKGNVLDKLNEVSHQNSKNNKLNIVHLINNVLISCNLNTSVLHLCSNRLQYFNWFQDWLLYNFNPWSFNVKRALKVLANYNSFKISFKLWAVLNESVKRHRGLWKHGKQGEDIYGEAPIDITVSEQVTKFFPMAFQSRVGSDCIVNENESVQLIARQSMGTNKCMKTNDEVVLRTKSKETLERSKKAQGKFLDLDENVVKINNCDYNKNTEIDLTVQKFLNSPNQSNEQNKSPYTEEELIISNEEDIYQPIWKFQTVGEALYDSDPEYYNLGNRSCNSTYLHKRKQRMSNDSSIPYLVVSDNGEDNGDWETDDEFLFSKQLDECCKADNIKPLQTSHCSTPQSNSTIYSIVSSADIIAASLNSNFQHPLLRSVCIFYSLIDPKIRAIVYDYTYTKSSYYLTKSKNANSLSYNKENTKLQPVNKPTIDWSSSLVDQQQNKAFPSSPINITPANNERATVFSLSSVYAWKLNLLNISNVEDEEDLIVSEKELLRSQAIKENTEYDSSPPKLSLPQLSKSVSSGNILDITNSDEKKTITERVRSKFPRSVFKLNVRSPKSEKKQNGVIRSAKTASLYLESDTQSQYPIFGAPLEKLEMSEVVHQNVPRFVVDCVAYIESKNFILQDGLYRASGNKVSIDELKRKLSESYIYDPNLLVSDDIHTITSLLKQFFRELSKPLIPQYIYDQIGQNFPESAGTETLKNILEEIPDPNRATLKFLIRHLKNVATFSKENRMPASNLAIVWGPCIFTSKQIVFGDIGRMNTLTKLFIENYDYIFNENERLVN